MNIFFYQHDLPLVFLATTILLLLGWQFKKLLSAWLALTLAVLAYGFYLAIFVAPADAEQGNVFRIFFYHVPSAIMALVFPYVNFVAALFYLGLRRSNPLGALKADAFALAAAEVTLVFTTICLATGILWGKAAWGIWWAWDARLTSLLLLWLLYVSYLLVRRFSPPARRRPSLPSSPSSPPLTCLSSTCPSAGGAPSILPPSSSADRIAALTPP